jgi:hypothetical protein
MLRVELVPFERTAAAPLKVSCTILNLEEGLVLQFQMDGEWENFLKPPPKTAPLRQDELWKSTCFECFIAPVSDAAYFEFNISPSGDWNAYAFDAYRTGMRPAPEFLAPRIYQSFSSSLSTRTDVLIPKPQFSRPSSELLIQPTLVLASLTGEISYWAGNHPAQKPDFHRLEYFNARLA